MKPQRRYAYCLITTSRFSPAVSCHFFKFRMIPCTNACQQCEEQELLTEPAEPLLEAIDGWGNQLQYGSCLSSHTHFRIESRGVVQCGQYLIPDPHPAYLWRCASPLATSDDAVYRWAQQLASATIAPHQQALALMHGVHHWISYHRYCTDNVTSAIEVFRSRQGVCQDYAHLMISACRSIGLAARYVNGLVIGQGETHAWVEVHDGEAWRGYDPTYDTQVEWGYIKLAHGRDVSDCPTNRGRFYSWTQETMTVSAAVSEV